MLAPAPTLPADHFSQITAEAPRFEQLRAEYDRFAETLEKATNAHEALQAFTAWDQRRRAFDTWAALTELQFRRDTKDARRKAAVEVLHELRPKVIGLDVTLKRRFLATPLRKELEAELGEYLFERWQTDVTAYDPAIEALAVKEAALEDRYTELLANASIPFRGEQYNLSNIGRFAESPDRSIRREAEFAKWAFFSEHRGDLDSIYGELVQLRDHMARQLELRNFTELAYRRLTRTDYGPAEVARWREEIVREIVPLAQRIVAQQASDLGVEQVMLWDERVFTPAGPPKPPERYEDMLAAAREAFDAIGSEIGSFARMMIDRELLDLQSRDGKAGGGFCTSFPAYGLPFVFANFNGTTHDVNVLVHELGHAFQNYSSRSIGIADYLWPTYEACEIHSMSMEFLAWPQLERFFGPDAQQYRIDHLKSSLVFLPYAAAIDHFQHYVYDHPQARPEERREFWKQLEAAYLPWRRYDGIEHLEQGGYWQVQRHVYFAPFYYIDYTLALCCALQFWSRSQDDYEGALEAYTALCKRGGQLPFQQLVRSAGLQSPFEAGVLSRVARRAAETIGA